MDKKKVSVFVAGQRFNIFTDESEKYVIDIAAKIDARISSLAISQCMTRERAAVLTALDFADDNEQDKRAIAEIKEQIKDYLTQIDRLSEENTALHAENHKLTREIASLQEQIESLKAVPASTPAPVVAEKPAPAPKPAEPAVTADDDLFFGDHAEPAVRPQKEKKNRHEHNHVNPYQQKYMQKKDEQKGYTPQRQYSLFDTDE